MKLNKLFYSLSSILLIGTLISCNINKGDNNETKPDPDYDVVIDNETHYLEFNIGGKNILQLAVYEEDTLEDLLPFFPTIPEKEGLKGVWVLPEKVYDKTIKVIVVTAEYVKI